MKRSDFITVEKKDGIATLWMDNKLEKMNVVSPAVINIMGPLFNELQADDTVKAMIIISRKPDFIAGADIKSFAIEKEGDFKPTQKKGHDALNQIENSKKPIIAAIHGSAFGLGVELPLACHARIATKHPRTKMGLPEVKIGLLPGGGGTQRLPRLVGLQKALEIMTTGKNIYAYQAKKMGLVDELTDKNKLHQAATMLAKRLIKTPMERKRKKSVMMRFLEDTSIGRGIVFSQAKKLAAKQTQGNYPAVPAIIECVERGYKNGIEDGYAAELEHFERLMLTPQSAALRKIFFDSSAKKKNPYPELVKPLNTLGMIGAGFMGAGIAEVSINNGIDVLLKDIKPEVITEAKKQIWKGIAKKIKYKTLSKTQGEATMGRVQGRLTYDDFDTADIVIEAVLEKMSLKKRIIDDIQKHCKKDVIIATNTSSLSVTEMAKHAKYPERVIGMHYFSPANKMPLLEIVTTDKTADWVVAACYAMGTKQGKTCIVVKDSPGFYVNRLLAPYINECLHMIDEGIAFDAIDKALKKKGFPVGAIALLDQVGLDIAAHVTKSSEKITEGRAGFEVNYGVVKMFEAGLKGRKGKKGFYIYNGKKKINPAAYQYFKGNGDKTLAPEIIQNRALMLLFNEAVQCLDGGIIQNVTDGDIGAIFGMGFLPFTGGPFSYMDSLGIDNVVKTMNDLAKTYGERFRPEPTLVRMAANGQTFYR